MIAGFPRLSTTRHGIVAYMEGLRGCTGRTRTVATERPSRPISFTAAVIRNATRALGVTK